ncbi:hypothetical protein AWM68_13330 [Fictibacillus phosphorivorans]|uniref:Methyltransferase domain-containing protein n=1 Tax=Fictibacillus phosphorivorans TaxID=1221500 RepID=A0A163PT10_9BACL|nr:methyltransferase domain-containing protein [Fictibacillus phosphorivorans]KZE64083.1 hypothetical protein AWM68_13330 [Fictibacillus phosphorivorans]
MEQYLDKVSEAYCGVLESRMAIESRKKIQWIVKKTTGQNILDVGCNKGIVSILLGREGKKVLGINDVATNATENAKKALNAEMKETQENVKFIAANFLQAELKEKCDTIIITDVLEHLISSKAFLEKTHNLLNEDGTIIITVPFGINDSTDYKRTLYVIEILSEIFPYFELEEIEFFGKWIGISGKRSSKLKKHENNFALDPSIIERAEQAFYEIERELVTQTEIQKKMIKYNELKYDELQSKNENLLTEKEKYKQERYKLLSQIDTLNKTIEIHEKYTDKREVDLEKTSNLHLETFQQIKKELLDENHKLHETLRVLKEESSKNRQALVNELDEKKVLVRSLKEDNTNLQGKLESLLIKQREEIDKLKSELHVEKITMETKLNHLASKNNVLTKEKETLDLENQKLKEKLLQQTQTIQEFTESLKTLKDEKGSLENEKQQIVIEFERQKELTLATMKEEIKSVEIEKQQVLTEYVEFKSKAVHQKVLAEESLKEKEQIINRLKEQYQSQNEEFITVKQHLESDVERLTKELEQSHLLTDKLKIAEEKLAKDLADKNSNIHALNDQISRLTDDYQAILADREYLTGTMDKERIEELNEKEKLLKELITAKTKNTQLEQKYNSLRNSKMGKMTVKYWELKRKATKGV